MVVAEEALANSRQNPAYRPAGIFFSLALKDRAGRLNSRGSELIRLLSFVAAWFLTCVPAMAWTEREISTGALHGTLITADGSKSKSHSNATVLILAGSGPVDRDGNLADARNDSLKHLAHDLANLGIGSLRVDKRGVGQSRVAGLREEDLRFDTYVVDAVEWLNVLHARRDTGRIFLLGHSEGALIATMAAQKADVAGLMLIAGAGESAGRVLVRQLSAAGAPSELQDESKRISKSLEQGIRVANIRPELMSLYRQSVQPYLMSWLPLDPAAELSRVKHPVLIVQGTTDLQVTVENASLLASAQPDAKLVMIDGMNHALREAPADRAANFATYRNPRLPLAKNLVPALSDFVSAH